MRKAIIRAKNRKTSGWRSRLAPVDPAGRVVLVVWIVVACLGIQELVPGPQHRRAVGKKQQRAEVLGLSGSEPEDVGGRVLVAFPTAVGAEVLDGPVTVAMTVGPVSLLAVADQVVEREPVVRRHEVDALERMERERQRIGEDVLASVDPPRGPPTSPASPRTNRRRSSRNLSFHCIHVSPGNCPPSSYPPPMSHGSAMQPRARELRVIRDHPDDRRIVEIERAVGVAGEDRGEVEAETIHSHLARPEVQAVEDHLPDVPVVGVERVAAAREVHVGPLRLTRQHVVGAVVDSLEPVDRSSLVAFARVIEHDVEDHFDVRFVQRPDHVAEFAQGPSPVLDARVLDVRREERERHVSQKSLPAGSC